MTASVPRAASRLSAGLVVASLLALGACKGEHLNTACQNDRFQLPRPTDGKMLAYVLNPLSIKYHYVSTRPDTVEYTWDTTQLYYGTACLRFATTDSVHIDNAGAFQLVLSGTNSELMRRRIASASGVITDSVVGYVFRGCDGDGGTYRLQVDSSLSFLWRNGQQEGVFGALALHVLHGDTVETSLNIGSASDTIRGSWRLKWGRGACGEGF